MTVDAGAGIPAAVLRRRVVDPHCHQVLCVHFDVGSEIHGEAGVPIGMPPDIAIVYPDFGVLEDALEGEGDALAPPGFRHGEALAIPPESVHEEAALRAARALRVTGQLDAPIVWQVEPAPRLIVELAGQPLGPEGGRLLGQMEAPVLVKTRLHGSTPCPGSGNVAACCVGATARGVFPDPDRSEVGFVHLKTGSSCSAMESPVVAKWP